MLLRRLTENVKDQNWFAVGLDFLIVVTGIFLGMQLTNWNAARQVDEAYAQARVRLVAETEANISAVQGLVAQYETSLPGVRQAIEVLRTCGDSPEQEAALIRGLNAIRGTASLKLRDTALSALTGDTALLSRQAEDERERLGEFHRKLLRTQETLDFLERLPFANPVADHPAIGVAELETLRLSDAPQDVLEYRSLILVVPVSAVCKDAAFGKLFYDWERVASFQILRARQFEIALSENLDAMSP